MHDKLTFCICTIFLCATHDCFTQSSYFHCPPVPVNYDRSYYFSIQYAFEEAGSAYTSSSDTSQVPAYTKFKVIKPHGSYYIIKFIDTLMMHEYFVPVEIFNCNAVAAHARYFSFSVTTLPIKVRPFPQEYFDWEVNKNLGAGFGYYGSWNHNQNISLGILFNAGVSTIVMDSFSTNGNLKDIIDTDVLSLALGTCFIFRKNFQIGLVGGYDFISSRYAEYYWVYNKTPWFGFGIGYSFVTILEQGF